MRRLVPLVALLGLGIVAGCRDKSPDAQVPRPRIISYAPSVTDILYDLGLGDHIVGVTSWCILPAGQVKQVVGSESDVNTEAILALQPDLIIVHQDLAPFEQVQVHRPTCRVISVRTKTVEGIIGSIETIAEAAGVSQRGRDLAGEVRRDLDELRSAAAGRDRPGVLFVHGFDHPYTCGAGTYVGELIEMAGGRNVAAEYYEGWPSINAEMVMKMAPDVLICQANAAEADKALEYWQRLADIPAVAKGRVYVSTCRRMTIPGSRIAEAAAQFAEYIHPRATTQESQP